MDIFKLVGSIYVDNTKANESISKTSKNAETLGGKLKSGLGTAAKWGAGIAAAATAVGTAMVASAKSTAANMDEIDKASQRMKVSAEAYQELSYASELCGVSMSTMESAAKKLEGTDLSFDDALDQIYALGTAEERAAKASELFGDKLAYEMTPMLNATGEEMANMRQEAQDLGLVMSEDTVKAGAELNDSFTKVEESFKSIGNQIGSAFLPLINDLLNWVVEHMPQIKEVISDVTNTITSLIQKLMPLIQAIAPLVESLWTNFIQPILYGVIDFLTGIFTGDIKGAFTSLLGIVKTIWNGLKAVMKEPLDWVLNLLNSWWQKATEPFRKLGEAIGNIWQSIKSVFKLPHFTISGSLNPAKWLTQGMPKIGVEWYAKGGIMNDPTMFGYNPYTNKAMIGGENGAEAIAPLSTLEDYFKEWSVNDELSNKLDNLINIISNYLPDIANKQLVLDTGAVVGGMSQTMNKELYKIKNREGRGL